jgi:hypothetical protein
LRRDLEWQVPGWTRMEEKLRRGAPDFVVSGIVSAN